MLPNGRLGPHGLAQDVVGISHSLVSAVLRNAPVLRHTADPVLLMTEQEMLTFDDMESKWVVRGGRVGGKVVGALGSARPGS